MGGFFVGRRGFIFLFYKKVLVMNILYRNFIFCKMERGKNRREKIVVYVLYIFMRFDMFLEVFIL